MRPNKEFRDARRRLPTTQMPFLQQLLPPLQQCQTIGMAALVLAMLQSFLTQSIVSASKRPILKRVHAEEGPVFLSASQNVTVAVGDRAVLNCRVDRLGTKTITWRRIGEEHPLTIGLFPFAPDARLSVDYNQRTDEWSLIIQDVKKEDGGIYLCQVSTKDDVDNTFEVQLNVRTVHVTGTEFVQLGSSVRLECSTTVQQDPLIDLNWFKDNRRLDSDNRAGLVVTKRLDNLKQLTSSLTINSALLAHSGVYVCRSTNLESSSITVNITEDLQINSLKAGDISAAERITGVQKNGRSRSGRTFRSDEKTKRLIILGVLINFLTVIVCVGHGRQFSI